MYGHDQRVQRVKSRIRLGYSIKDVPYHVSRYVIFASETDSYRLIVLIYTILNCYPHHVTVTHILYCVVKEIVHTGYKMTDTISVLVRGVIDALEAALPLR